MWAVDENHHCPSHCDSRGRHNRRKWQGCGRHGEAAGGALGTVLVESGHQGVDQAGRAAGQSTDFTKYKVTIIK
jgi:hypothetical protein